MIEGKRIFTMSSNTSIQGLGGGEGAVVLAVDTGQLHTCNDTTAAFLTALDGKRTFDLAVAELQKQFDVDHDELRADLTEIAAQLLDEGIIV